VSYIRIMVSWLNHSCDWVTKNRFVLFVGYLLVFQGSDLSGGCLYGYLLSTRVFDIVIWKK